MDSFQRCLLRDREFDGLGRIDALTELRILAQNCARWSSGLHGLRGVGRSDGGDGRVCVYHGRELEAGMCDGDLSGRKRLSSEVAHNEGRVGLGG